MFLQSYIYRATDTLHLMMTTSTDFVVTCHKNGIESQDVVTAGLRDLWNCAGRYVGATCVADSVSDIRTIRKSVEAVKGACHDVVAAIERSIPIGSSLSQASRWRLPELLCRMKKMNWDTWKGGKAMFYDGAYCRSFVDGFVAEKRSTSALKCIAKYSTVEGYALFQTLKQLEGKSWGDVPADAGVRWHDLCDISIPLCDMNTTYMSIFDTDRLEDYYKSVLLYWIQLAKDSAQQPV